MRINSVKIMTTGVQFIDVDTGKLVNMMIGASRHLIKTGVGDREYLIIDGNRIGATTAYFLQLETEKAVELTRVPEDGDATWDGIPLPLTGSAQIKSKLPIAKLILGELVCDRCSMNLILTYPDAIPVYPVNVFPYDQDCHKCGQMLVKTSKDGGRILFKKYIKPEKKKK